MLGGRLFDFANVIVPEFEVPGVVIVGGRPRVVCVLWADGAGW